MSNTRRMLEPVLMLVAFPGAYLLGWRYPDVGNILFVALAASALAVKIIGRRRGRAYRGSWQPTSPDEQPGLRVIMSPDEVLDHTALSVVCVASTARAGASFTESPFYYSAAALLFGVLFALAHWFPSPPSGTVTVTNIGVYVGRRFFPWEQIQGVQILDEDGIVLITPKRRVVIKGGDYGMWDTELLHVIRTYWAQPERRAELATFTSPGTP